jgi:hypothetical protein
VMHLLIYSLTGDIEYTGLPGSEQRCYDAT